MNIGFSDQAYDLSFFGWEAIEKFGIDRIITLRSPSTNQPKAYGLPAYVTSKRAIDVARKRGFIVDGIVRQKKPWRAEDVKCLIEWVN